MKQEKKSPGKTTCHKWQNKYIENINTLMYIKLKIFVI